MDINQLKTFVAVAREGGITRASERLHLSQPAVSAHIKAMEDTLGLTLFDRTPKGMRLTGEGGCLLAKAEGILEAHRTLLEEASRLKGRMAGTLRLGVGSSASTRALGRLLSTLAATHPEVSVELRHAPSTQVLDALLDGGLDAGFYNELEDPDPALSVLDVSAFGIMLVAPLGWVSDRDRLDWKALERLPWIVPNTDTHCGLAADHLFRRQRLRPDRVIATSGEEVTRTLVRGGVGLGFLHDRTARDAAAAGELDSLYPVRDSVRVLFAHREDRSDDPIIAAARVILGAPHAEA